MEYWDTWILDTGYRILDTGYRDTRYWTQGYWIQEYWMILDTLYSLDILYPGSRTVQVARHWSPVRADGQLSVCGGGLGTPPLVLPLW